MASLYDYYISGSFLGTVCPLLNTVPPPPDHTFQRQLSQTFTPSQSYVITTVRLFLYRVGSPGVFNVEIYATDISGHPTGAVLANGSSNGNTLTTSSSGSGRDVSLGVGTTLSSGTQYAIVLDTVNAVAGSDVVFWMRNNAGTLTGGEALTYPEYVDDETENADWQSLGGDFKFANYGDPATPSKATNPTPANGATEVDFSNLTLSWEDGGGATGFDVYIGESGNLTQVSAYQAGTSYITSISELETIFGTSPIDQVIYWRIDAVNLDGTTTGDEWNFDGRPAKATTPSPSDDGEGIKRDTENVTWVDGGNSTSYDFYFGTTSGNLTLIESGVTDLNYLMPPSDSFLDGSTTYYWRIDSNNNLGTTTGDEWTFDTEVSYSTFSRYSDYDPDSYWQFTGGSYQWASAAVAGGGRYHQQLIVIGHNTIYYGDI